MQNETLFALPEPESATGETAGPADGDPRIKYAVRNQVELVETDLDSLVPSDHQVRIVWAFVEGQDLAPLYDLVAARGSAPGRRAIDPRILMALWLNATLDGVGSARELDRRCAEEIGYRWICGGVSVNHHTLSDFRTAHAELLDGLLTRNVASLMAEGLVDLNRVAQDGMRVRASAGAASYRSRTPRKPPVQCAERGTNRQLCAVSSERFTGSQITNLRSEFSKHESQAAN